MIDVLLCMCVCVFTCFPEFLHMGHLMHFYAFQGWDSAILSKQIQFSQGKNKLLIVVSCSGKLNSVSLQLRANSRASS